MAQELNTPETATGNAKMAGVVKFGTKSDVASMTQMSRRWVDTQLAEGCPHLKIGPRRVRFNLPETAEWIERKFRVVRRK